MSEKVIYHGDKYEAGELVDHFLLKGYKPAAALKRATAVFEGRDECSHPSGEVVALPAGENGDVDHCNLCGSYL